MGVLRGTPRIVSIHVETLCGQFNIRLPIYKPIENTVIYTFYLFISITYNVQEFPYLDNHYSFSNHKILWHVLLIPVTFAVPLGGHLKYNGQIRVLATDKRLNIFVTSYSNVLFLADLNGV